MKAYRGQFIQETPQKSPDHLVSGPDFTLATAANIVCPNASPVKVNVCSFHQFVKMGNIEAMDNLNLSFVNILQQRAEGRMLLLSKGQARREKTQPSFTY